MLVGSYDEAAFKQCFSLLATFLTFHTPLLCVSKTWARAVEAFKTSLLPFGRCFSLMATFLTLHTPLLYVSKAWARAFEAFREWLRPKRLGLGRFELVNTSGGETIALRDYSGRIYQETDISWVLRIAGELIDWPLGSLSLVVGRRTFKWCHRIALRDRTSLLKLRAECVKEGVIHPAGTLKIGVVLDAPPERFERGSCICDFRGYGCCVTGRTDGWSRCCEQIMQRGLEAHYECRLCGNNGCCRSGNCGHPCCEEYDEALTG